MVLCFGDSITQGRPGITYLKYIKNKKKFKNYGLGGDTLIGVCKRITYTLENSNYNDYLIEIGANDILLPYLRTYSVKWRLKTDYLFKRGSIPCKNKEEFESKYRQLIYILINRTKNIKIVSIPCIGEELNTKLNYTVDTFNEVINNLTEKFSIDYIDFNAWQKKVIKAKNEKNTYFISKEPFDVIYDTFLTTYLPFSRYVSNKRGCVSTIDGIHLNNTGAKGLASLIEERYIETI